MKRPACSFSARTESSSNTDGRRRAKKNVSSVLFLGGSDVQGPVIRGVPSSGGQVSLDFYEPMPRNCDLGGALALPRSPTERYMMTLKVTYAHCPKRAPRSRTHGDAAQHVAH